MVVAPDGGYALPGALPDGGYALSGLQNTP